MNREALTKKANELYEQVKKTEFGNVIIEPGRHAKHIEQMSLPSLEAVIRFYEAIIDPSEE